LARAPAEVSAQAVQLSKGGSAITFPAFTDETQTLESDPCEIDLVHPYLQAVHGRGVRQHELDRPDVDAQGHGTGALLRALPAEPDQPFSVQRDHVARAQLSLELVEGCGFGPARRFADDAHVSDVEVDQVAKRAEAS